MQLVIQHDGSVCCVYDEVIDLAALGPLKISRVSHVEPDADGHWYADLSPVAPGTVLGPYDRRSEALAAERDWLTRHWLSHRTSRS